MCAQLYESSSFVGVFFSSFKKQCRQRCYANEWRHFPAFCRVLTYVVHTHRQKVNVAFCRKKKLLYHKMCIHTNGTQLEKQLARRARKQDFFCVVIFSPAKKERIIISSKETLQRYCLSQHPYLLASIFHLHFVDQGD